MIRQQQKKKRRIFWSLGNIISRKGLGASPVNEKKKGGGKKGHGGKSVGNREKDGKKCVTAELQVRRRDVRSLSMKGEEISREKKKTTFL